jgi:hypothetical protein
MAVLLYTRPELVQGSLAPRNPTRAPLRDLANRLTRCSKGSAGQSVCLPDPSGILPAPMYVRERRMGLSPLCHAHGIDGHVRQWDTLLVEYAYHEFVIR